MFSLCYTVIFKFHELLNVLALDFTMYLIQHITRQIRLKDIIRIFEIHATIKVFYFTGNPGIKYLYQHSNRIRSIPVSNNIHDQSFVHFPNIPNGGYGIMCCQHIVEMTYFYLAFSYQLITYFIYIIGVINIDQIEKYAVAYPYLWR